MTRRFQTFGIEGKGGIWPFALALAFSLDGAAWAQTTAPSPAAPLRTLFDTKRGEDILRGHGGSLGYTLSNGGIMPASVLVTRNGVTQRAGVDYTLDAQGGILTLTRAASADETILVRYRYTPGVVGLTGGAVAKIGSNGIAPSYVAGMPSMDFGRVGLGFVRTDTGEATNALLRLNTPGLAFFSGGGLSQRASSLVDGKSEGGESQSAQQYLLSQNLTLGGKGSQVFLNYQNVSKDFKNFAALKQMQAAPDADLGQLEKERGLKRMGFGANLGSKANANLQFSQNTLSGGGGDIARQSISLASGGLSLTANTLSVDKDFTRWKDLSAKDLVPGMNQEQFQKNMSGVTKRDIGGKWLLGNGLSFEGSTVDWKRDLADNKQDTQKDTRMAAQFAPKNGLTLSLLNESSRKTTGGKTEEKAARTLSFATNPAKPNALGYTTKTLMTKSAGGVRRIETQKNATAKMRIVLPKTPISALKLPVFTLRGERETVDVEEDAEGKSARSTDTIATLFGIRTEGNTPLKLNYEERSKSIRPGDGDATENHARLVETSWRLQKSALFSYMTNTDDTTIGDAKTGIAKENVAIEFGRGYQWMQSLEKTLRTSAQGDTTEVRTDTVKFATDPAAPLYMAGEHKETQGLQDASEVQQVWRTGLSLGGLSFKVDGLGVRRLNMPSVIANEKNISVTGALKLFAGFTARYNFYDRADKDPQTKLFRDETLREWTLDSGVKSPLKVGFVSRTFENRGTKQAERVRQEATFSPVKSIALGLLKNGQITFAYGTDSIRDSDREGVTRKIVYGGTLGGHKLDFEYGSGRDANGLPAISKAVTFTARAGQRLSLSTRQGMRDGYKKEDARESQWSRRWDVGYKLGKYQTVNYSVALRPEKPDTTWEQRRAEQMGYTLLFGNGGKFTCDYRDAADFTKLAGSRTATFSLVSPASAVTSYEFSYQKEATILGDKRGEMNTYILAYQYLPTDKPLSVVIGARWHDYGGTLAAPFDINERATATIEIKGSW